METKNIHVQIRKSEKKVSRLPNETIWELQIGAGFRNYKSAQEVLHLGAALKILNRGIKVANRDRITNRSRDYKLVQKRVGQLSRSSYSKSDSNECFISIPIKKVLIHQEKTLFQVSLKIGKPGKY